MPTQRSIVYVFDASKGFEPLTEDYETPELPLLQLAMQHKYKLIHEPKQKSKPFFANYGAIYFRNV